MPLDPQFIAKVRPQPKPRRYSDGPRGNGLALQVQPSGSKQWIQRLTVDGKRRDLGLGGYPAIGLKDARELAFAQKAALTRERTLSRIAARVASVAQVAQAPAQQAPPPRRPQPTFAKVADQYRANNRGAWKPSTLRLWDSVRRNHVDPKLARLPVDTITRAHVLDTLEPPFITTVPHRANLRSASFDPF